MSLLSLGLHVAGAFFPERYHQYFKLPNKTTVTPWYPTHHFQDTSFPVGSIYFLSGSTDMIAEKVAALPQKLSVIACAEFAFEGLSTKCCRRRWYKLLQLFKRLGFFTRPLLDTGFGGATSARLTFGFSPAVLASNQLPSAPCVSSRSLAHYIAPDVGFVCWNAVRASSLPPVPTSLLPQWFDHKGQHILRREGTWPCGMVHARVTCPSIYSKDFLLIRHLSCDELMSLYQQPAWIKDLEGVRASLPFLDSALPVIFTSILRQLWGVPGGVSLDNEVREVAGGNTSDEGMTETHSDDNREETL